MQTRGLLGYPPLPIRIFMTSSNQPKKLLERVCNRNEVRYLVELTGSGPTILSCEVFNDYVTGKGVSFTKALFSRDALNDIKLCGFGCLCGNRVETSNNHLNSGNSYYLFNPRIPVANSPLPSRSPRRFRTIPPLYVYGLMS
jgi:hypothetical protein